MVTLYKTGPAGRINYYSVNDRQGHLFSEYSFSVTWGPGLTAGREKMHVFDNRRDMDAKLQGLLQARIKSGYRVLYTYFRNHEYEQLRPALTKAEVS